MAQKKHNAKPDIPKSAIKLTTYQELTEYAEAFAKGGINLLILIGEAGLQKSRTFSASTDENVCWISGYGLPCFIYMKLYRHCDQLVVIDDADNLYTNKDGITLLKHLCQTEKEKKVSWQTNTTVLDKHNVPREFKTRSNVAIIANEWHTLDRNVAALEDRGHVVWFSPSRQAIHARVRDWFDDDEIYDWFGDRLHLIKSPSMRMYFKALELKKIGLPWKRIVPDDSHQQSIKTMKMVKELVCCDDYETQEERVRQFVQMGGGCRTTFFKYLKRLHA